LPSLPQPAANPPTARAATPATTVRIQRALTRWFSLWCRWPPRHAPRPPWST
jgi:hypothetical protein